MGGRRGTEALRHRDYALFWWSSLVSNTGGWVQNVTVPFVLYELTDSAAWVGLATFAQFIPAVILGPLAGSLADRLPRRRILLTTQWLLTGLSAVLWALWVSDLARPGVIVAVVSLMGVVMAFNITGWQAFVSELVPRSVLPNAVALNSAQFNASRAFGPALGGIVLAAAGPGWALAVNPVSYLAVILALLAIAERPAVAPTTERPRVLREFGGTVRYVRERPGLATCVVSVVLLGVLGSPVVSLTVVFAEDVFHVGRFAYGFLGACLGLGAILGTPLVTGWAAGIPRGRLVGVTLPVYGAAVAAFALAPVYAIGAIALVVAGASYLAVAAALNTTLQLQVDEAMRGKVLSSYLMAFTAAIPVGGLVQGTLVDVFGPRPVVATSGFVLVGAATWLLIRGRLHALTAGELPPAAGAPTAGAAATGSVVGLADEGPAGLAALE